MGFWGLDEVCRDYVIVSVFGEVYYASYEDDYETDTEWPSSVIFLI